VAKTASSPLARKVENKRGENASHPHAGRKRKDPKENHPHNGKTNTEENRLREEKKRMKKRASGGRRAPFSSALKRRGEQSGISPREGGDT